ncbi:hypothetical protein SASPL_148521 [Salvia splendens]|uniref:Uncharacterized protein n=1 Tax=Salvia splendens TaxID=180675 RepID=A0A8X8Z3S4_SALSN|nr:hypothetical protein SASPL_148521 [Salvia splendens]
MSERETVDYLFHKAKIETYLTKTVWQRLEEGNPNFFKAYHLRLTLKAQITRFNELLEKQVELMSQTGRGVPSNGSHIHSMHNNSDYQAQQRAENMHQAVTILPGDGVLVPVNMSMPENMLLTQNSIAQGMNDVMIEANPENKLASVSPFTSAWDPMETSSFGQIPHNLSVSDFATYFSNDTGGLDSYSMQVPVNMSVPENMLFTQNSIWQGMNDVIMESELEGGFMNNLKEVENTIGEASISVFNSVGDPMETSSFEQIPHNLSGTDLTAYFANDTGELGLPQRYHKPTTRLDTISKGLSNDEQLNLMRRAEA